MPSRRSRLACFCVSTWCLVGFAACSSGDGTGGGTAGAEGTGVVEVVTQTTGTEVDPDGYEVQVDGSAPMSIGVDDAVLFEDESSGPHVVWLSGTSENCCVLPDNPRGVTVTADETVSTTFMIMCGPGAKGRIAIESNRDGDFEIFTMNADGSGVANLTDNPAIDVEPAWSPDGTRIAFRSDRDGDDEIFVMNADGSNLMQLTNNDAYDGDPDWSPDGERLVFDTGRDGNDEIYVMDADGTNSARVTDDPGIDYAPSWWPGGDRIVFTGERAGVFDIFQIDVDGSNRVDLTNSPADDDLASWSPDGTQIAFSSDRNGGNDDIYVMNADGSNVRRVTTHEATDLFPSWSPDGTQIVFRSDREGNPEVYRTDLDGGCPVNLSSSKDTDCHPDWTAP